VAMLGSQAIFSSSEKERRDVVAMLQQDMTGYVENTLKAGKPEVVGVITDYVDQGYHGGGGRRGAAASATAAAAVAATAPTASASTLCRSSPRAPATAAVAAAASSSCACDGAVGVAADLAQVLGRDDALLPAFFYLFIYLFSTRMRPW